MITSTANKQVKNLIQLQKKAKARREQQVFVAEGKKMFLEAPVELVKKVYVSESFLMEDGNKKMLTDTEYEVLRDSVHKTVSDTGTPQGILSVVSMPKWDVQKLLEKKDGLFLLLEGIQDPGNLGTMVRSGEGAGITAIIVNSTTADLYNPKTVRSTMGSIFRVPFVVAEDFYRMMEELKGHSVKICAAHLAGSVSYDTPDYRGGTALLIGNEGNGLTRETEALWDERVRIPMEGKVESLNAGIAAAILMYEAKRQRRG